jgi:hypothetical protein
MRKAASYFLIAVFATQAAGLFAQTPQKPEPQFALTISEWHEGGFPPNYHRLRVIGTNTSNEELTVGGCEVQRGAYRISVVYDGAPLVEKNLAARHQREEDARHNICNHELGINKIEPGGSFEHLVYISGDYDMSKPGTYEVTVSRETDPEHSEKSVTVRSNTLTIIVPEPDASEPN